MSNKEIEQVIQDKGLTAPRVTAVDIVNNIKEEHYFTAGDALEHVYQGGPAWQTTSPAVDTLTFCVLVLNNGFTVTGESACASPENFDAEIGKKIARQNAINKVWPLMGYALKESLSAVK